MAIAAVLAITLIRPYGCFLLTWILQVSTRFLCRVVNALLVARFTVRRPTDQQAFDEDLSPVCEFTLRHKWATVIVAVLIVIATIPIFNRLGSEFMRSL